jgi:hypothetical protein
MRLAPALGADRRRAATKARHACLAAPSPRRLELPFVEHGFPWLRFQFSGSAENLPGSRDGFARCWRWRKPSHNLAASFDVHRFSTELDSSNELETTGAELCHRNVHIGILYGHLWSHKR